MKLLNHILRWANLLLVLATLLAYLAPHVSPAQFWPLSFFGLAYPIFLFANIGFVIYWAIRGDRYAWFSVACIVVGLGYFNSFVGLSMSGKPAQSEKNITLLTHNVGAFQGYPSSNTQSRQKNKERFGEFATTLGPAPTIVCLQEAKGKPAELATLLDCPNHHSVKLNYILSKYPITAKGEVPFGNETTNSCIWADVKTPSGTIRVYNLHLQSNRMSQTANRIATDGDLRQRSTWRDVRFVMARYKSAVGIRAKQAQLVAKHMAKSPHPIVLCGDLNDPPVSYVYKLLSNGLQDSFKERGSGIGSTFAGKLPFLRIDYVLPDKSFKVLQHRVLPLRISDHKPVVVTLRQGR